MDQPARLQYLFDKYLRGECSAAERSELLSIIRDSDAGNILHGQMKELWDLHQGSIKEYPVDWDNMYRQIVDMQPPVENSSETASRGKRQMWSRIAIAASLICLTIGGFWYFNRKPLVRQEPPVASGVPRLPSQRSTILLPDGSTVILNAGSKLDHPEAFNGKTRDVYLVGEAYFDIKHKPAQFFLVHTGKLITKVLGTAFDIKAYPGAQSIEITVTRGKVQVLKGTKNLGTLNPNQQISVSNNTAAVERRVVDTKTVLAWHSEDLVFDDISMEQVTEELEKKFGGHIVFDNPNIKDCKLSATFLPGASLEEILTVVCPVINAHYKLQENKVIIYGKGCR